MAVRNPIAPAGSQAKAMATNANRLQTRPAGGFDLSWLRLPSLTMRTALPPAPGQPAPLPDPCLADPLQPETWRPLVDARIKAERLADPKTAGRLALVGRA